MTKQAHSALTVISGAIVALLIASPFVVRASTSAEPAAQTSTPTADVAPQPLITNPPLRAVYTATLEASFDWGDLGPDWQTELGIQGNETLWFRWKIGATTAKKGRWEISDSNDGLLAQGEAGAAQTVGDYGLFLLDLNTLGLSPPFKIRLQALTGTGSEVGNISPPVLLNQAVDTGVMTCFTDGGLGLPIDDKLEAIRAARGVPALAGAVVTKYGMEVFDAVGIRKIVSNPADQVAVTKYDKWHLGSDTKAMTSMLVGILRQYDPSTVGWNTSVADAFPEWAGTMDASIAQTTLRQLLAHRSGLYLISDDQNAKLTQANLSVTQQRRAFTHAGKTCSTSQPWGHYDNSGPTSYGYGWGISESGDKVLGHDGSNTYWYARALVYVDKGYALLAATNAAGLGGVNPGMEAVNDTTIMLESYHSGCPDYGGSRRFSTSRGR